MRTLELANFSRGRSQIAYTARFADLQFSASFWYDTVDFYDLERRYGADFMQCIYFHMVAFDLNRLVSLKPDVIDFGDFNRFVTPSFTDLWNAVFRGSWAQWRYENDLPSYAGPTPVSMASHKIKPVPFDFGPTGARSLVFFGGGKDSLLAMRLLDVVDEPVSTLVYSHSVYGNHAKQHRIIEALLARCRTQGRHRIWVNDDFLATPVVALCPELGVRSVLAAETPTAVFTALPVAMAHGLKYLIAAHEKSADRSNMTWEAADVEVNHQWAKSLEAETYLSSYIRKQLLTDLRYFSILKPIHDPPIFASLVDALDAVRFAHSCNVDKPWCGRCAKCVYVWLGYCAYLPENLPRQIFGRNLFDEEVNDVWFRQLLGLEEHTPFECVGHVDEVRLAFELCRVRGYEGRALELYQRAFRHGPSRREVEAIFRVDREHHLIPGDLGSKVLPVLESKAKSAEHWVWSRLGWTP